MAVQKIAWEGPLAIQEVATRLKATLFGPIAEQAVPEAIRAEIIRVALWEQSIFRQPSTFSEASTRTQQLLSRARTLWTPFHDATLQLKIQDEYTAENGWQEEEALNRQTLDVLAEQGDLLALPLGHWLPAPLRLVPATPELYLLVGGMPSSLLSEPALSTLRLHGSFRQVPATIIERNLSLHEEDHLWQFQALEQWLGTSPPDFQELLSRFRNIEMELVTHQDASQHIEAYNASVDEPQWHRWQSLEHISVNGRYLLREKTLWGKVTYSVGEIQNRQIKKQSHLLESLDIRRLCYALDADANVSTKASWKKEGEQGLLTLSTELPAWERKQLATLGRLQSTGKKYYPRIWQVPLQYESTIKRLLAHLGVSIK